MEILGIAWLLALANAVWFGVMAQKVGRNWVLWGLGGGVLALVTATIILGLGQASIIPFSNRERFYVEIKLAILALVVIFLLGWIITTGLHRPIWDFRKWFGPKPPPQQPPSPSGGASASQGKPPAP
jgi:hypothetical protein